MEDTRPFLSRLPNEVLDIILSQIGGDTTSLDSFCEATKGETKLHGAGLARRWQKVSIDDRDLIPLPRNETLDRLDEILEQYDLKRIWKPAGYGIRALLTMTMPGHCPANYVQELLFNFRMARYETKDLKILSSDLGGCIPPEPCLKYNLELLGPHLFSIRTIRYDGLLPQVALEGLANFTHAEQIQSLALQHHNGLPLLQFALSNASSMNPHWRSLLSYDAIRGFTGLRSLAIHRLAHLEVSSLCKLLPTFSRLESLVLGDEEHDWRGGAGKVNGCGMRIFLEHVLYGPETTSTEQNTVSTPSSVLPSTLTSLILVDNHAWESLGETSPRELVASSAPLTNLSVYTDGLQYISKLARCFANASLRTLMVSGSTKPYQKPNHFHELQDLISAHQSTLKRIKILQAWTCTKDFAQTFNEHWHSRFVIEELVLGSRDFTRKAFTTLQEWYSPSVPVLMQYLDAFHEGPNPGLNPKKWGDRLKRIRIDEISLSNLDATVLDQPRFTNLKILMLQPFDEGPMPDFRLAEFIRSWSHIDKTHAQTLAESVLAHASSSLRIIVLQDHWFWIAGSDSDGHRTRIWSWSEAERNTEQAQDMREVISDTDWIFLKSTIPPFWNARLLSATRTPRLAYSSAYSTRDVKNRWNYMVALPVPPS